MSPLERCVYFELLQLQHLQGGPFEYDPSRLARQVRVDRLELERAWLAVSEMFEQDARGRWFNAKMQAEIDRSEGQQEQASKAGRASAEARARQRTLERCEATPVLTPVATDVGTPVPTGRPTECSTTPTPTPTPSAEPDSVPTEPALFGAEAAPPRRGGRRKPNPVNVAFAGWWEDRWLEQRGEEWRWSAKERAGVDSVRGHAQGDLQAMQARAENLLASSDAWVAQNAAPSLLASRWNQFAVLVQKLPQSKSQRLLQDLASRMEKHNGTP